MKKTILTTVCILILCFFAIAQNQKQSPKIISTSPEFGDCNVDPKITEIIIKFDQDMSSGMSLLDTRNMPEKTAKAKWIDNRTYSIPVKLYSNKLYSLAFNNSRFQGFKNTEGIPLNPFELHFMTKRVPDKLANKQSYSELLKIFPSQYSYSSLKNINWLKLLEENREEFENAETDTEFALKLIKILKEADDPHLWVEVNKQRFETGKVKAVEPNFGAKQLFSKIKKKRVSDNFLSLVGVIDSTGYISIKTWNAELNKLNYKWWGSSKNHAISFEKVFNSLLVYPNLIIDVRGNSGGNEKFAKELASYFVTDSVNYEKVIVYNKESGSFDKELVKVLHPNKKKVYKGNVFVLSGPKVMSSNESFILMMQQAPNAKIVGMETYGSSANPIPFELTNGVKVYLPSWQAYTLDNILIEGNGIKPDIEILTTGKDFKNNDILVERVLDLIKN